MSVWRWIGLAALVNRHLTATRGRPYTVLGDKRVCGGPVPVDVPRRRSFRRPPRKENFSVPSQGRLRDDLFCVLDEPREEMSTGRGARGRAGRDADRLGALDGGRRLAETDDDRQVQNDDDDERDDAVGDELEVLEDVHHEVVVVGRVARPRVALTVETHRPEDVTVVDGHDRRKHHRRPPATPKSASSSLLL